MSDYQSLSALAQAARRDALTMIYQAGSGHPGGALSAIELLTQLYFRQLRFRPEQADWTGRDRFVLSKGHACPALYAIGALAGLLPRAALATFRRLEGPLQGHPHVGATPWVEASTGSLGQGFSAAIGMALGLRHQGLENEVYAMLGDGELQEGQVWEGAMFAAHYRLNKLCVLIDYNKLQSDDTNARVLGLEPLADKWRAFGWELHEIDGHDLPQIEAALSAFRQPRSRPFAILAHTAKGKGVRYMEGQPPWHGSVKLSAAQLRDALVDLGCDEAEIAARLDGSIWEVTP